MVEAISQAGRFVRGAAAGFSKIVGPLMAAAMRRANRKDLARLKEILEGSR
jgi:hypothetical protein